jgi:hypothetical protein
MQAITTSSQEYTNLGRQFAVAIKLFMVATQIFVSSIRDLTHNLLEVLTILLKHFCKSGGVEIENRKHKRMSIYKIFLFNKLILVVCCTKHNTQ